jgi:hypothetical protein
MRVAVYPVLKTEGEAKFTTQAACTGPLARYLAAQGNLMKG